MQDVNKPRFVLILVVCIYISVILVIAFKILSYGFMPPDDALRHVAKVISGKDWTQILVLRPGITLDSHVGWHKILELIYETIRLDKDGLIVFSVVSLFFFLCIVPLFFLKRPESWLIALLIVSVANFWSMFRIFLGRPFIFTMTVVVLLGFIWPRLKEKPVPWGPVIVLTVMIALATWIHCLWYMFALPVLCLFLARKWRAGFVVAICTLVGVLIGIMMTGSPIQFVEQTIRHFFLSFGSHTLTRQLVSEFQPFNGDPMMVFVVMFFLGWRSIRKEWNIQLIMTPMFILMMISWTFGFLAIRVWLDWGIPALLVWMTLEFEEYLKKSVDSLSYKRVWLTASLACVLFLSITNDNNNRWTNYSPKECLSVENPRHKEWLPEKGGIFYHSNMFLFYQTFYANPNAEWRYVLGFEPSMMTKEDLTVFRNAQLSGAAQSYAPWIQKMRKEDRLVLTSTVIPQIKELKWYQAIPNTWIGRLP